MGTNEYLEKLMANEVFISYSRKDYDKVKAVKDEIDRLVGIDCWMDLNGIESGEWFKKVIISAINRHDTLLFMLTPNSMNSPFAMKELGFAARKGKRIVLVDLEETQLNDDFLFDYLDKDNIDWNDSLQHDKLINNLQLWFPVTPKKKDEKVAYPVFFPEIEKPVIYVLFLIDCSGSMYGDRMEVVNKACSEVFSTFNIINPDVDIKVNVLSFGTDVSWTYPAPVSIEDFTWITFEPQGLTSFGRACSELDSKMSRNDFLNTIYGQNKSLIVLITDGEPTDDFEGPLRSLQCNQFFRKANKFAIGIGEDFNEQILARFAGNKRVFALSDDNVSKLNPLLERIMHLGLYAASNAALDEDMSTVESDNSLFFELARNLNNMYTDFLIIYDNFPIFDNDLIYEKIELPCDARYKERIQNLVNSLGLLESVLQKIINDKDTYRIYIQRLQEIDSKVLYLYPNRDVLDMNNLIDVVKIINIVQRKLKNPTMGRLISARLATNVGKGLEYYNEDVRSFFFIGNVICNEVTPDYVNNVGAAILHDLYMILPDDSKQQIIPRLVKNFSDAEEIGDLYHITLGK